MKILFALKKIARYVHTIVFVILLNTFSISNSFSQCTCTLNMSFEKAGGPCDGEQNPYSPNGWAKGGCSPDGWVPCAYDNGTTPSTTDIQPGMYGFDDLSPTHGLTYMSGWATDEEDGERASLRLCAGTSLIAGTQYCFSIDFNRNGAFNAPTRLQITGGTSACSRTQVLWTSPSSGSVSPTQWGTWNFCFTPTGNWTYLTFIIIDDASDGGFGGHLGIDNWRSTDGRFPPAPPCINVTTTPATVCNGTCGTITSSAGGGTPGYTYSWNPGGATTSSISVCPASTTTYTVTARDNNGSGSSATATAVVTVNPKPTVSVPAATICNGSSTTLTASGANTYTWSPTTGLSSGTGTTVTANPTATSTYTVVGTTTATGCTNSTTVVVTVNPKPTVSVPAATICNGSSTTLTASGANTYAWSPTTGLSSGTGTTVTANPTATSTYTVVGTSAAGCTGSTTVVVTVNPKPTVTVPGATICNGSSTTLTASGASTYTWSPATGLSATTGSTVTANPTATSTYTVVGTSAAGCTNFTTVVVMVNPIPVVSVPPATICAGSSTTLTASGATTYIWSPTTGLSSGTGTTVTANPSATTTYTVIGTTSGCTGSTTVVVTVNPIPVVSVPAASICPGGATPLTASGATTYTWSPGTGLSSTTGNPVTANPAATSTYTVVGTTSGCTGSTTVVVTVGALVANAGPDVTICAGGSANLGASGGTVFTWTPATGLSNAAISNPVANPTVTTTYTVNVSDGSCSDDDVVIVTVNPNPVVSVPNAAICNGKSTTLTASGATTYTWAPASGLSATTGATVTANPTATTTYTVTGSFATGCTNSTTVVVTVNPNPTITIPGATICQGQSVSLTATGADTYAWSPATGLSSTTGSSVTANPTVTTTYTITGTTTATGCTGSGSVVVTVIPPCGPSVNATGYTVCNGVCGTVTSTATGGTPPYTYSWNTGAATASINVCPAVTTTYTITVTDNSTPVGSASAIAVVTVNPNPVVSVPSATICNGSSATLTASGADTYTWSPSTGLSDPNIANPVANPSSTTTYTVAGTFTTGCTGVTTVVVTVNPIPVVSVPNANICPGGSTVLNASGANSYSWSPAAGLSATTGASVTANPSATTTYTVCGTTNGCSSCTTVSVTVGALVADAGPDKFICPGSSTQLNATGGTIFTWTPATGLDNPNIANPIANPTVTTTYTVNVSDGTCSDEDIVIVTVNPPIVLNTAGIDVTCFGACNGQLIVIPSGGTSPYSYAWSTGCATAACNNICAGAYTLVTTDAMGCTASATAAVNEPTAVTGTSSVITANCNQSDGSASATGSGGTGPYTYSWNSAPVQNTQTAVNIPAGNYVVTITDANGCSTTVAAVVPNAPGVVASIASFVNVSCYAGTDGSATANATGGTAPYTYNWALSGGNAVTAANLAAGSYTVTVTDDNGCTSTASVIISQPTRINVSAANARMCPNSSASLTASGTGGTGGINYSWNPGGLTGNPVTVSPAVTTTYTLIGTDANGCTGQNTVVVTVDPAPIISVPAAAICEGTNTTLTASGADTYSWSPASGLSNSAIGNPIANPTATTTYTVIGTTNANGCTSSATVVVTVNLRPLLSATGGNACPGDSIPLSVLGAGSYSWSPSTGLSSNSGPNVTGAPPVTTVYTVIGTGGNGCTSSITVTADVNPNPNANFITSPEVVDEFNPTIYFTDLSSGGVITTWNWSFGDPNNSGSFSQNPLFTYPPVSGGYIINLVVTNQFGCIDSATNTVFIRGIYTFYIPNTFTPNGDGTNDVFLPKGVGIDEEDYHLWIFDRWGNLIWQTETWGQAWDGKANGGADIAQIDTYVWKVHVREKETQAKHNYIGHVNIVR